MEDLMKDMAEIFHQAHKKTIGYICMLWTIGALLIYGYMYFSGGLDRDSTDGIERSGMGLYVDQLTGCNYLSVSGGGITPRISSDGRHYGCRG